jgi:hypothetical protein
VPFPANYGGVIDVFYKLKSLAEIGLSITLHCFDYGRGESKELLNFCKDVHYYKRSNSFINQLNLTPYIVKSRINDRLLKNLLLDEAPILFEGLHTCGIISHEKLEGRLKIVRTHNIEHEYYNGLAKAELNIFMKTYYYLEANKLKKYEEVLSHADSILAISNQDYHHFKKINKNVHLYAPFIEGKVWRGEVTNLSDYCLYHGNLSVAENEKSVCFLIDVFSTINNKLIVAGKDPSRKLEEKVAACNNIEIIANPSDEYLGKLIASAKINCLPTFQSTGIKLKLINTLAQGNLVLVNDLMIVGNDLGTFCEVVNSKEEWIKAITELSLSKVDLNQIRKRHEDISLKYNNKENAMRLQELLV